MRVLIAYIKLVITTEPKTFCFDLPKDGDNNLEHGNDSIIKHSEHLAEHAIKTMVRPLLSKYRHENDIHEYRKQ